MNLDSINSRELIEYISKEVMKQIKSINEMDNKREIQGDRILAIAKSDKYFLEDYKDLFPIDYFDNSREIVDIGPYKYLVLEGICIQRLASISMGLAGDRISSTVIDFILQDKKIYILNEGLEYHQYKKTANVSFYKLLRSYEDKVKAFGIDFINKIDLRSLSENIHTNGQIKEIKQGNQDQGQLYSIKGRIVSEANLRKIHREGYGKILVRKETIITPLAKDYIRNKGISILIE